MTCPRCHAPLDPGDRFCAECGVRIGPAAPASALPGARAEATGPGLAGQTDPGVTHTRNQDAFALSGPGDGGSGVIMVLCDGVSNSQTPERAADVAARTAHDALTASRIAGTDPATAMDAAIRAAHGAVCALPFDRQATIDPPATTIIAAWIQAERATLGWLGDSRAYLLSAAPRLLTRDHSWMALATERGDMTDADARRDPRAHALVHCLGTTDFTRPTACPNPGIATVPAPEGEPTPAWLVLCSDGLWNYAETAAALLQAASEGLHTDAPDLCARLVDFARISGGHDNITVLAASISANPPRVPDPQNRHQLTTTTSQSVGTPQIGSGAVGS